MMTMVIDGVATVREVRPHLVGKKLVGRFPGPVVKPVLVKPVRTLHFLQENNVHVQRAQALTRLVQHHALVEVRQTFVDIVGCDTQFHGITANRVANEHRSETAPASVPGIKRTTKGGITNRLSPQSPEGAGVNAKYRLNLKNRRNALMACGPHAA